MNWNNAIKVNRKPGVAEWRDLLCSRRLARISHGPPNFVGEPDFKLLCVPPMGR
jgi:hypothetical protein